ncbi:MAG: hemolysin-like protein, partial [Alphaproteobacteria bacterium]
MSGSAEMMRGARAGPSASPIEAPPLPGLAPGGRRIVDIVSGPLQVRLAESAADIEAAQALRYRVFYEIMGARPLAGMERLRRDFDGYDR